MTCTARSLYLLWLSFVLSSHVFFPCWSASRTLLSSHLIIHTQKGKHASQRLITFWRRLHHSESINRKLLTATVVVRIDRHQTFKMMVVVVVVGEVTSRKGQHRKFVSLTHSALARAFFQRNRSNKTKHEKCHIIINEQSHHHHHRRRHHHQRHQGQARQRPKRLVKCWYRDIG